MSKELIDGRYRIIDIVRKDTYVCENISTGVKWILKKIGKDKLDAVNSLGYIRHPALPRLVENIIREQHVYAVFEYINGSTLSDICLRHNGKIDHMSACKYMRDIAEAVHFLHTNEPYPILHLDIKPSNIVIQDDGKACLIDFGSMMISNTQTASQDPLLTTTCSYAPLELLNGSAPSAASDIYMIGMTLLRSMTGVDNTDVPDTQDPHLNELIPSQLISMISRCLMFSPQDRYASAVEIVHELNEIISGEHFDQISENISVSGKGKVICIWGNAHFASELAWIMSESGSDTLLIDADLLAPAVDKLAGIKDRSGRRNVSSSSKCSLSLIMNEYDAGRLNPDRIRDLSDATSSDRLRCLCGDYRMEDYDHYSTEGLASIIRKAVRDHDYVRVACSKFIYDEFTCISFICADRIMIPITAGHLGFREFMKYVDFLAARKQIRKDKVCYIGFEYRSDEDLGTGTCQELCQGKYSGTVSFSSRRRMLSGSARPYVLHIEQKIKRQYLRLIDKLDMK